MFKLNENTIECLRDNFDEMVLSDPVILRLYQVVSLFDTEERAPAMYGNLHAFIDIKKDGWLSEKWEEFEEDLTIKDRIELIRQRLVEELKDEIREEIEY